MPEESLKGAADAIRKLNELADDNGKFAKQSMRRALREEAKTLRAFMLSVIAAETGLTRAALKVRAGKRSRIGISMLVGVFGLARKGPLSTFFAGFANYGHKTPGGGHVTGLQWTEKVKTTMGGSAEAIGKTLSEEVTTIARGS